MGFVPKVDTNSSGKTQSKQKTEKARLKAGKLTLDEMEYIKKMCRILECAYQNKNGYSIRQEDGTTIWKYDSDKLEEALRGVLLPRMLQAEGYSFDDFISDNVNINFQNYYNKIKKMIEKNFYSFAAVRGFYKGDRYGDAYDGEIERALSALIVPVLEENEKTIGREAK